MDGSAEVVALLVVETWEVVVDASDVVVETSEAVEVAAAGTQSRS